MQKSRISRNGDNDVDADDDDYYDVADDDDENDDDDHNTSTRIHIVMPTPATLLACKSRCMISCV
jgi:hypothetical protein